MALNISIFNFHGRLASPDKLALQANIKEELSKIASQIMTSLKGSWEVNVWDAVDNPSNWPSAGIHKLFLKAGEADSEHYVQALTLSWLSLLRVCRISVPLVLTINRPGALSFHNVAQNDSTVSEKPIAKPDANELKGEWEPENPRYTRKQWIVSDSIKGSFDDAVSIIRNSEKIYKVWGFEEVDPNPRAVLCFYGPAGTGKTMAAHVLASELNRKIIAAKYSQIESKYVGDAPKNLRRVFEEAKATNAVLFFDEADSFLGKRMENVSSGSEQAINSLRGEMLILLEEYRGVVVFATNLLTNIDRAFESRIISKIEFEMPNAEARRMMIRSKIPSKAPIEESFGEAELDKLVELSDGFSGRVIRSAMLMSLVKAARRAEETGVDVVRYVDFEEAFAEQKKTAESIDKQYKVSKGTSELEIPENAQQPLLDLAADAIAGSECKQKKIK